MLRFFATAVCVLLTITAAGQKPRKQTVVLNDGSRISGTLVSDSSDYLEIRVNSPQVIRVAKPHISSIEDIVYPVKKNFNTEGLYIKFSSAILTGKNAGGNESSLSFNLSTGYHFKNGIGVGVGSGMEELGVVLVPLYADFNYTPVKSRISPFFWLKSGYGFATSEPEVTYEFYSSSESKTKGGFLFNTGAGISMYTRQRTAVSIGIGYRYQKTTTSRDSWWWGGSAIRETETHFNRLELQLGFTFR